ncbi:SRPBCC family protein [Photorhabdus viridis]|uniref:SRPBCC family protein n=1 Tax=Photorhabdus viridis TaxID=3163327 RepID=UPI0033070A1A
MNYYESHSIICNTQAEKVYQVIVNSEKWPEIFEPCQEVKVIFRDKDSEKIEIKALINGIIMQWVSERKFHVETFSIRSKLTKPMTLVKEMETSWRVIEINSQQCMLMLEHDYDIEPEITGLVDGVETTQQAHEFISKGIDLNSVKELNNIKSIVEVDERAEKKLNGNLIHSIICEASAKDVYTLVKDVSYWPDIFSFCEGAEVLNRIDDSELVEIKARQNNKTVSWQTKRYYSDSIYRIDYVLPKPMPLLKAMNGRWQVIPINDQRCLLTVQRNWSLLDDVSGIIDDVDNHDQANFFIISFINDNTKMEMDSIKNKVESNKKSDLLTFTTGYYIPHQVDDVYDIFLNINDWSQILPHCDSVKIIHNDDRHQEFNMEVSTPNGNETFRSIRFCDRDNLLIEYFQPEPPLVLRSHSGSWRIFSRGSGSFIFSNHNVELDHNLCAIKFGTEDKLRQQEIVKNAISENSKKMVFACKEWLDDRI